MQQVSRGLPVAAALEQTVGELKAAGGSFKKLRQKQDKEQESQQRQMNPGHLQLKSMPLTLDFDVLDGCEA